MKRCEHVYQNHGTARSVAAAQCRNPAEWEMTPSTGVTQVYACSEHVGELLGDAPQILVVPLQVKSAMRKDTIQRMV